MNSYADVNYYANGFAGEKMMNKVVDLKEKLILASQKIDEVTYNRIVGKGFENLTLFQQQKIKDAVCHQANYLFKKDNGVSDIVSYNVLDISVSVQQKETEASNRDMSELAWTAIKQTGLASGIL